MADTADIVVIGGGVIGASTAFHLASKGAKNVVLVDKGAICSGETHKSGGFIQTHWDHPGEVKLIAAARQMFMHWNDVVGGDCGTSTAAGPRAHSAMAYIGFTRPKAA